ncbi:MAG TPA: fimbria/pilus periplasmic chaperone, partial [Granulicella sp.]|nr:fimbria/pilus periplasmic chaperone [Granulicella sp.]
MATVLTVGNQSNHEIAFQIRAFAWQQNRAGDDQLAATDELLASPPLASVAPGASQVARLVLRRPPQGREATYRILLDELPPAGQAGRVHVALRLSIPV